MAEVDSYTRYYQEKLWGLLPAAYRALGMPAEGESEALRELLRRIGASAAELRRQMDRLWMDQSIETADDRIIPFIADLLATRLVSAMDVRGQRRDVAKTIYYRRRAGTVALLEELAEDVASVESRVVEGFRRLGRTRHLFDPRIGEAPFFTSGKIAPPPDVGQGLQGLYTRTPMGGYADLRNQFGAAQAHSAFDEFAHTADFRLGRRNVGWHAIPKAEVFLWWLRSVPVVESTPVEYVTCPGQYTFDPAGREVPLFAQRTESGRYGEDWTSPDAWRVPAPVSRYLWYAQSDKLYGSSLAVWEGDRLPNQGYRAVEMERLVINPERGRFRRRAASPAFVANNVHVSWAYGFGGNIGAGALAPREERPTAASIEIDDHPAGLAAAIGALGGEDSIVLRRSITYDRPSDVDVKVRLGVVAGTSQRPVVRWPQAPSGGWRITGEAGAELVFEGVHFVGTPIAIEGEFKRVSFRCCTLDPGTAGSTTAYAAAADGVTLAPTRLFVHADVGELSFERCILGPIDARSANLTTLSISDSIVQSLPAVLGQSAEPAISTTSGDVVLNRVTVLGRLTVHRLEASDCILQDLAVAEDFQHGCVRFSAYATGSQIPQPYESVGIAAAAPLFRSEEFGMPRYTWLREDVDTTILSGEKGATISTGAEDGSEMGAFSSERVALKSRGLRLKFAEFLPIGIEPVWVNQD